MSLHGTIFDFKSVNLSVCTYRAVVYYHFSFLHKTIMIKFFQLIWCERFNVFVFYSGIASIIIYINPVLTLQISIYILQCMIALHQGKRGLCRTKKFSWCNFVSLLVRWVSESHRNNLFMSDIHRKIIYSYPTSIKWCFTHIRY